VPKHFIRLKVHSEFRNQTLCICTKEHFCAKFLFLSLSPYDSPSVHMTLKWRDRYQNFSLFLGASQLLHPEMAEPINAKHVFLSMKSSVSRILCQIILKNKFGQWFPQYKKIENKPLCILRRFLCEISLSFSLLLRLESMNFFMEIVSHGRWW